MAERLGLGARLQHFQRGGKAFLDRHGDRLSLEGAACCTGSDCCIEPPKAPKCSFVTPPGCRQLDGFGIIRTIKKAMLRRIAAGAGAVAPMLADVLSQINATTQVAPASSSAGPSLASSFRSRRRLPCIPFCSRLSRCPAGFRSA